MEVAKHLPGQYNVPYVAGMNVTNLPTTTFSVSNTIATANIYGDVPVDANLGTTDYCVLMWMPIATSINGFEMGGDRPSIPSSDKLGGFSIKMWNNTDIDTPYYNAGIFNEA